MIEAHPGPSDEFWARITEKFVPEPGLFRIGERWAKGLQPKDTRDALLEVALFLIATPAEPWLRDCLTRDSTMWQAKNWVDGYLARKPRRWEPGMWKERINRLVAYPMYWRSQGQCEDCREQGWDVTHHLHYRSVGCELPTDLLLLCRPCHRTRHVYAGQFYADPETRPDAHEWAA